MTGKGRKPLPYHERGKNMNKWFIVRRGAQVLDMTFTSIEEAELIALTLAATEGTIWTVQMVIGWDK